jgi:hypothetical protein
MSVDWDGYAPYLPPIHEPVRQVSRSKAREAFEQLMASKAGRRESLRELVGRSGVNLTAVDTDIQALNDWFRGNVEPSPDEVGRLGNLWYAVVNDISLVLGDVMIERAPTLRWEMFTSGSKNVAYQRHVIVGFTKVVNPKYNIDVDRVVAAYGHQIISGAPVASDTFVSMLRSAKSQA